MTYAIFKAAGFQYRAEPGDILRLPTLEAEAGATVTFDEVLFGSADGEAMVGRPTVKGAAVKAEVIRHGRADKVIVYKFKRRKGYRRKQGHRQDFTEVRVSEIDLGGGKKAVAETAVPKAPAKKKAAKKKVAEAEKAEAAAPAKKPAAKKSTAKKKSSTKKKTTKKKTTKKKTTGKKSKKKSSKKSSSKSKKKKS